MGPKSARINAYILYAPLLAVVVLALLAQYFYLVPFLIGFAFFFKAKRSVIHSGNLVSFGPSQMTKKMKTFYWLGYAIMISSVALSAWLAIQTRPVS